MSETNRDSFAAEVNAMLDETDPEKWMRRFTVEEGQRAWDGKPSEIAPDAAVRTYVQNVIKAYQEMPDNGSD